MEVCDLEVIVFKFVSISFCIGEYMFDENVKYIIDKEFVEIVKVFVNVCVWIEGNIDNIGFCSLNVVLLECCVCLVVNYLIKEYGMLFNCLIIVGNGFDKFLVSNNIDEGCV